VSRILDTTGGLGDQDTLVNWVSKILLDTTGGLGEQDTLVSWVSKILDTTGELNDQDSGYYWWAGCARCWILQVG